MDRKNVTSKRMAMKKNFPRKRLSVEVGAHLLLSWQPTTVLPRQGSGGNVCQTDRKENGRDQPGRYFSNEEGKGLTLRRVSKVQ